MLNCVTLIIVTINHSKVLMLNCITLAYRISKPVQQLEVFSLHAVRLITCNPVSIVTGLTKSNCWCTRITELY